MVKQSAFVFIKPHANTDAVVKVVKEKFAEKKITILSEGRITSEVIDEKKLIDQHYYAIASKATILKPHQLNIPKDVFQKTFGLTWEEALEKKVVFNALDACAELGLSAQEMDREWGRAKKANKLVKMGGGFYCGLIEIPGKTPIYSFNGFFMEMRCKFTAPGLAITTFVVEFDSEVLPWADFRGKVLGPTDPAAAPADSLRGIVMRDWKQLGLAAEPNTGDNGVHASASPFEGLAERMNWLGVPVAADTFGQQLLAAGIPEETIKEWSVDPVVDVEGAKKSLFDSLEDLDADACVAKAKLIAKA